MALDTTPRPEHEELGFAPDVIREKYRVERDKRLRADGIDQYVQATGSYARYLDDPHAAPDLERAPLHDEVDVLIVGGGFGGLVCGARLRQAGIQDIRILEAGGDFGGTWYWNRYPGAQCDIESYVYMPLLEELDYMPTEKYAHGPEILAHAQAIGRHFDLYDDVCFQTRVTALHWDEDASRWVVHTDRDDRIRARFVCMANGPLSTPKLPGIPGVEDFQGHTFHTSRWDYTYTGGDTTGSLTRLHDKRVGVIGTGATAIQCVPHLGAAAQQLYVFQRTPSSVDVRGNRPTDPEFARGLEPGWQQRRMDNFNILVGGGFQEEDLVADGWTDIFRNLMAMLSEDPDLSPEALELKAELADMKTMERVRARVDSIVEDPAVAEALKPWYRQFCKRPCFHDEYLPTFNRPNVQLVDTQGKGVERITETGVVVAGDEYEVDCLIFATGFEVGTAYTRRAGYELHGRDGRKLSDKWADGLRTFQGFHTHGFPNAFFMMGFQSGITPNVPHAINEQSQYLAQLIRQALDAGATRVEASEQAEHDWVELVEGTPPRNAGFQESCTPGYYNNEGKPNEGDGWFGTFYPEGFEAFFRYLREYRATRTFEGLEIE